LKRKRAAEIKRPGGNGKRGEERAPTTRLKWLSNTLRHIISPEAKMDYKVVVHESEEGFSVSCPGLPGCWSQGATEAEALENIQDAIREYLAAIDDLVKGQDVREVRVAV
jgi:predicted RNase H-like HicB family nuclease